MDRIRAHLNCAAMPVELICGGPRGPMPSLAAGWRHGSAVPLAMMGLCCLCRPLSLALASGALGGGALGLVFVLAGLLLVLRWRGRPGAQLLVLFLVAVSLWRIWFVSYGPYDLSGDEAQYWDWSRRPDWNYYTKGPVVAYCIWLGKAVFGDTTLGVRCMAIVFSFASSLLLYVLGRRLYDEKAAAWSGALLQVVPILAVYGVGMTIDSPLVFFWTLALLLFHWAISSGSRAAWILLGVAVGIGLLTKYTMAFFWVCAFLFLVCSRQRRGRLRRPWPYLGVLASALLLVPVLIWNYQHDWVNFRHNLGHTKIAEGLQFTFMGLLEFVGSQLGIVTPILLALMLYSLIRRRKQDPFCFWFSIPIMAFFLLKSIQGKVEPNWALTSYIIAAVSFSGFFLRGFGAFNKHVKRIVVAGVIVAAAGTALAHYPSVITLVGLPAKWDPSRQVQGYRQMGQEVSQLAATMDKPYFIFSDRYMVTAAMAFYVKGHPVTYCVNLGRRMNQYDLWPTFHHLVHYDAIYVTHDSDKLPRELDKAFASHARFEVRILDRRGDEIRRFTIYLCRDFAGMPLVMPERY